MKSALTLMSALLLAALIAGQGAAADRMVGVRPADGTAKFVKVFEVQSGTTIRGVAFESNGDFETFSSVALLTGAIHSLAEATVVTSVSNVEDTGPGTVSVTWTSPIEVSETTDYYVAIQPPASSGKIGANVGGAASGSFVAGGEDGTLVRIRGDLAVELIATAPGGSKAEAPLLQTEDTARTYFRAGTPNPAAGSSRLEFGLAHPASVTLAVYDIAGRRVRTLVAGTLPAGTYQREWDGRDDRGNAVARGIYFVKFQVDDQIMTQKVVLTK